MASPILVTGGTGLHGRHLVPLLGQAGHPVRDLSRSGGAVGSGIESLRGDLRLNEGLDRALAGVRTVVHLAGGPKGDDEGTRNLVYAAKAAGVRHIVYVSVVGADRVPIRSAVDRGMFGYFAAKLASERIIAESGIPWTILRATQFHQALVGLMDQMAKLPAVPYPAGVRFQPIDTGEVAARLLELTLAEPAGMVPELAGPRVHAMAELIRSYLRARGTHKLLIPLPLPGAAARSFRAGANLSPRPPLGQRTWEEVLASEVSETHGAKPTKALVA